MMGTRKFTDRGSLAQSMPLSAVCGILGALASFSFPPTSGLITESTVAQAAADEHRTLTGSRARCCWRRIGSGTEAGVVLGVFGLTLLFSFLR